MSGMDDTSASDAASALPKAASMTERLFFKYEEMIRSGGLAPGSRLPTQERICAEEKVSRTVVREAMARLEAQGLSVSRHGSGVFVAENARFRAFQVTPDELSELSDIVNLLEMRLAVEAEMAAFAAARRSVDDIEAMRDALRAMADVSDDVMAAAQADVAFHLAIARATKNRYYVRIIDFLGIRLVPPRSRYLRDDDALAHREYAATVRLEHDAIIDAIVRMDVGSAREAARRHMQESLSRHSALSDRLRHAAA